MWDWIGSFFKRSKSIWQSAFKTVEHIAEKSLPIIAEVDDVKLSYDAAESSKARWQVVADFLVKHVGATKDAGILVNMPRADMLTKLAIIAVQTAFPKVPSGYIRAAVGLAWVAHSLMKQPEAEQAPPA